MLIPAAQNVMILLPIIKRQKDQIPEKFMRPKNADAKKKNNLGKSLTN